MTIDPYRPPYTTSARTTQDPESEATPPWAPTNDHASAEDLPRREAGRAAGTENVRSGTNTEHTRDQDAQGCFGRSFRTPPAINEMTLWPQMRGLVRRVVFMMR